MPQKNHIFTPNLFVHVLIHIKNSFQTTNHYSVSFKQEIMENKITKCKQNSNVKKKKYNQKNLSHPIQTNLHIKKSIKARTFNNKKNNAIKNTMCNPSYKAP